VRCARIRAGSEAATATVEGTGGKERGERSRVRLCSCYFSRAVGCRQFDPGSRLAARPREWRGREVDVHPGRPVASRLPLLVLDRARTSRPNYHDVFNRLVCFKYSSFYCRQGFSTFFTSTSAYHCHLGFDDKSWGNGTEFSLLQRMRNELITGTVSKAQSSSSLVVAVCRSTKASTVQLW
jgi:hypothetical protein